MVIGTAETNKANKKTSIAVPIRQVLSCQHVQNGINQRSASGILVCLAPVTRATESKDSHKSAAEFFSRARRAKTTAAKA
jgi:DNA integrity scanning protein DisA with diadenylate cyclase activity